MSEQEKLENWIVALLLLVTHFLAGVAGMAFGGGQVTRLHQREAVKAVAATWESGENGEVVFKYLKE